MTCMNIIFQFLVNAHSSPPRFYSKPIIHSSCIIPLICQLLYTPVQPTHVQRHQAPATSSPSKLAKASVCESLSCSWAVSLMMRAASSSDVGCWHKQSDIFWQGAELINAPVNYHSPAFLNGDHGHAMLYVLSSSFTSIHIYSHLSTSIHIYPHLSTSFLHEFTSIHINSHHFYMNSHHFYCISIHDHISSLDILFEISVSC
jgi:hypothetical protein